MIEVFDALGKAYGLTVLENNRPAAVVAARTQGNRCGCFVSKTALDLLTDALQGPKP